MVAESKEKGTEIVEQRDLADVVALEVVKEALVDDCGDLSPPSTGSGFHPVVQRSMNFRRMIRTNRRLVRSMNL